MSSHCNHGHYMDTGEPVKHECITIPLLALVAERAGDYETAVRLLEASVRRSNGRT